MKKIFFFLSIFLFHSFAFAQPAVWTVSYFQGERDTIISLPHCRLISVSSDSLTVQTDSAQRQVSIYLLKELSRPDSGGFHPMPMVIGSALGLSLGLVFSSVNASPPDAESRSATSVMFAVMGGGLGLIKSFDEETIRYKFPFGLSNPEKREIIEHILAEEKRVR